MSACRALRARVSRVPRARAAHVARASRARRARVPRTSRARVAHTETRVMHSVPVRKVSRVVRPALDMHVLDNPALAALSGPQAGFAVGRGRVLRYHPEVSPFLALPDDPGPADWAALAELLGPGGTGAVPGPAGPPPADWDVLLELPGVQMIDTGMTAYPDAEAVRLGAADVPEMLALVSRTEPGPFLPRTHELGTYLGIRRDGELVAMAGERMRPPGWTEISAVCTDEAYRGQGLGTRLVRAVAAGIRERGEVPFLHAAATNIAAIRLYRELGFVVHRELMFVAVQAPGG
jgi:ribosomal protein S18 acetylase RimI-like enzyme